jgi:cell pole-organizing protein PopZ
MDTILASIRRILNEDEVSPAEERHDADDREHGGRDKDDVLVLGESMMVPPDKPEPAPTPVPAVPPIPDPAASPARASSSDRAAIESLVAARTRAAAAQSFEALHEALRREQTPVAQPSASHAPTLLRAGGPTLEDLVRDELRGLLSNWLDVHLPGLVETLVRSEIEKLTRRGG